MDKLKGWTVLILMIVSGLVYSIDYTIDNRSMAGAYALGVVSTLIIGALFWSMQLVSTWLHSAWEQKRFQDNAKENYANLLAQQKIQNEQTKGALMLANDSRKYAPQQEQENYLVFDESVFDSLEGE